MRALLLCLFASVWIGTVLGQVPSCCVDSVTVNKTSQVPPLEVAKNFIYDLADLDSATDVVLSQHVLVQEADDEMYDYLLASLDEIRLNLMSKRIDEIEFIPYSKMPQNEVRDIDIEDQDIHNMFFLRYGKRQVTALYIDQGKIASFSLVSKGNNKAHFVTY